MLRVCVLGAGKIGISIVKMFSQTGDYTVQAGDTNRQALAALRSLPHVTTHEVDVQDRQQLADFLHGQDAVVSACAFQLNPLIAQMALKTGCSYFDLTEDVAVTRAIRELAESARPGQVFMPQSGLAPGFISILGNHLGGQFDTLHSLKLRVGALPVYASNPILYNLTWSTEGLVNEYCNPCQAIVHGEPAELQALEGLENFSLDGVGYEAFNTSGGLGTLCETWHGRIQELTYKTIRYPGHQYLMDFLINGLHLGDPGERRELLKRLVETAVPTTHQDLVLIFVTATGLINGELRQLTDSRKLYHRTLFDEPWSAIQIATAAGLCAVADLVLQRCRSPEGRDLRGFLPQEYIDYPSLVSNRFGLYFHGENTSRRSQDNGY